ncbi:hypothetical protein [Caldilinea sp.]|uniref:hypothetical protein n=1 Tax=Caldilinea sp. TaxID=2293560 RepID=UPI00260758FC|nr:hypothetical protein [Caldilinea sp.]
MTPSGAAPVSLLRRLAYCAAMILALLASAPAMAQEGNRAGLVIAHGDGSVAARCVAFDESSLSGAELLMRSGLDLAMEAGAMGVAVCRIDGEGCNFPQESCFCQCESSPCFYWSYWRLKGGEWVYSNLGAGNTTVRHGDVEGWRWGASAGETAEPPPPMTFEQICASSMATQQTTPISESKTSDEGAGDRGAGEQSIGEAGEQRDDGQTHEGAMAKNEETVSAAPSPVAAVGALLGALAALPVAALLIVWLRRSARRRP